MASVMVLCPVAGIGAALSFQSLHEAAVPIFGTLAFGFPLLVDMLILGSTLAFLAGATVGRKLSGWRWTAHGGVVATLLLNALAASSPATVPWHVTPALVWSVLVEMTARQVTGDWAALNESEAIPVRLWISSPLDATRTWLRMARTGERCHRQARADLAVLAAAEQALRTVMPRRSQRGARRLIHKQLRAGAMDPTVVLGFLRGQHENTAGHHTAVVIEAFLTKEPHVEIDVTAETGSEVLNPPRRSDPDTIRPERRPRETHPRRSGGEPRTADAQPAADRPVAGVPTTQPRDLRLQAAIEIVRVREDIDGPQLAHELTSLGWKLSTRTARRVLAQASREIGLSYPDSDDHRSQPSQPSTTGEQGPHRPYRKLHHAGRDQAL